MTPEIEAARKELQGIARKHGEANQRLKSLKEKLAVLEQSTPRMDEGVSQAEAEKDRVLELFVVEKATQRELDTARDSVARARAARDDAEELAEAYSMAINNTRAEIEALGREHSLVETGFWRAVAAYKVEELRQSYTPAMEEAFACWWRAWGHDAGNFFTTVWPMRLDQKHLRELSESKFLGGPK